MLGLKNIVPKKKVKYVINILLEWAIPDTQCICLCLFVDCLTCRPLESRSPPVLQGMQVSWDSTWHKRGRGQALLGKAAAKPTWELERRWANKNSHGLATKKYHQLCYDGISEMHAYMTPSPSLFNICLIPINISSTHSSANSAKWVCKGLNSCPGQKSNWWKKWGKAWDSKSKGKHSVSWVIYLRTCWGLRSWDRKGLFFLQTCAVSRKPAAGTDTLTGSSRLICAPV